MASAFWQTVLRFDSSKLAPEVAFRNTVGIVLPLLVGAAMGRPAEAAVVALGALNVCYSDSREAYSVRGRRMLLASVLVAIAVAVGALSARNNAIAAIAAMIWAFGVGMLVVLGPKAADLGLVSLVTLIIFAAKQLSLTEALVSGALAFGGGLLQTVLSLAIWPVRPYGPERRIIGNLYRTLAAIATSPAGAGGAPPASAAVIDAGEALSMLQTDLPNEAERLVFLLNQAERIRLSVLTLRRLARRLSRDESGKTAVEAVEHILELCSQALKTIAEQAETGDTPGRVAHVRIMDEFGKAARDFYHGEWPASSTMVAALLRDTKRQVNALAGQLRAAAGLTSRSVRATAVAVHGDETGRRARLIANLSFRSTAFRHAVRLAVCVGLGAALGNWLHVERPYWIPMTIAIVLKPDFLSTFSRGILRIAGTLVGLFIATVAYYLLPETLSVHVALLAGFSVLLRWLGPGNYGVFVAAVSGMIVLLMSLTGVKPTEVVLPRTINTALGGALALLIYRAWPTWERTQTSGVLADMLDAYRLYAQAVMQARLDHSAHRVLASVRNAARLARTNAEASVGRFVAEPGISKERRTLANEMLISSHTFARAAMAIESDLDAVRDPQVAETAHEFAVRAEGALEWMAAALRNACKTPGPFPNVREAWTALDTASRAAGQPHSLLVVEADRIGTSLNTLREQIAKWNSGRC
jgi:uncharacterized membrane protein YccC